MRTRNKTVGVEKTQRAGNKASSKKVTEQKRVNARNSAKSESTKKLNLKECYVKLVKCDLTVQKQSCCPKGDDEVTKSKSKKGTLIKNLKKSNNKGKNTALQADVTTAPATRLRSRRLVKYAESSLEISKSEEKPNANKIPIYDKPVITNEKVTKRKEDEYEFDSDSEQHKKGKRRKLDKSDSYNETIQKIIKNIAKKAKQKNQKILGEQKVPLNNKKLTKVTVLRNDKELELAKNSTKSKIPDGLPLNRKDITCNDEENLIHAVLNENDEVYVEERHTVDDDVDSDDEYFKPATFEKTPSPKIKVLSDIQLRPTKDLNASIASPRLFKDGKPNANSTMLGRNILTPWRFNDINITRNPHFILIKQSALPCISQEMVLDHSLVDKLNKSTCLDQENWRRKEAAQEVRTDGTKLFLQPTLNDYFDGTSNNKENNNQTKLSLFDNDLLSPIKTTDRFISNKRNVVKRKILGEKNDNIMTTTANNDTPEEVIRNEDDGNKNLTNFGFDSESDNDVENDTPKEKVDKPFRLSFKANDKKYQPKQKMKTKRIEPTVLSDYEESSASDASDSENENGEIKIFEDFHNTKSLVEIQEEKIGIKTQTRKHKNDKGLQKQKKRKDVRTAKEEEEAEKWATAFNSMCEEIEQFPLEIE